MSDKVHFWKIQCAWKELQRLHPSICCVPYPVAGSWGAEANPLARDGVHPGRVTSQSQGWYTPIDLTTGIQSSQTPHRKASGGFQHRTFLLWVWRVLTILNYNEHPSSSAGVQWPMTDKLAPQAADPTIKWWMKTSNHFLIFFFAKVLGFF